MFDIFGVEFMWEGFFSLNFKFEFYDPIRKLKTYFTEIKSNIIDSSFKDIAITSEYIKRKYFLL